MKKRISNFISKSYLAIFLLFMYAPILVMMLLAFNNSGSIASFVNYHFGLKYFAEFFHATSFWQVILTTLAISISSTIIATIIGTLAAISLWRMNKKITNFVIGINNIPLMNADILTATALLVFFLGMFLPFGFFTLLCAHISFAIPYVLITVLTRIKTIDTNIIDSSYDLGASPLVTLRKIILPIIKPGIWIGAGLAFAMSFDDFIISYFTSGNLENISIYLYTQKSLTPIVNVFFVIILLGILLISIGKALIKVLFKRKLNKAEALIRINQKLFQLSLSNSLTKEKEIQKLHQEKSKITIAMTKNVKEYGKMKYFFFTSWKKILNLAILVIMLFGGTGILVFYYETTKNSISFATYGSYFDDPTFDDFKQKTGININTTTFGTNEELGAKLLTHKFDFFIDSDYYVSHLLDAENNYNNPKIQPINYSLLGKYINQFLSSNDPLKMQSFFLQSGWQKKTNSLFQQPGQTNETTFFNQSLMEKIMTTPSSNGNRQNNWEKTYQLPYVWGSLVLVHDDPTYNKVGSMQTIWNAIHNKKQIYLSDDARNTIMFIIQLMLSYNKFNPNNQEPSLNPNLLLDKNGKSSSCSKRAITYDGENACSASAINTAESWFINKILNDDGMKKHFHFQGDEIQEQLGNWIKNSQYTGDIALLYSSDYEYSNKKYKLTGNTGKNLLPAVIQQTTGNMNNYDGFNNNLWVDGLSVASHLPTSTLNKVYQFLGYVYAKQNYEHLLNFNGAVSTINYLDKNTPLYQNQVSQFSQLNYSLDGNLNWPSTSLFKGYSVYSFEFNSEYADAYSRIYANNSN